MSHANEISTENGYTLHIVPTEKYKTNCIVWKMKAPLEKETVTKRALLPYVLQSSTEQFKNAPLLRAYLEELYGASLFVNVGKKGEYHIMTFSLEIANEKFLSDPTPLLEKGLRLLMDILFKPHASNNAFNDKEVEQEKRTLKQRIQSLNDDKMKYSSNRLVEEMCKNEPYGLEVNGDEKEVDAITPASLYEYYQYAMQNDELDLFVVGDVDPKYVQSLCRQLVKLQPREPKVQASAHVRQDIKVNEVIEKQAIMQGKLNIGYRTGITYGDDDYYALQVFNGIFGGFSHSKLFMEVREKNSLAYYAASRLESHKGLLIVVSGIQNENYEKTLTIINEQMESMKKGDFSDDIIVQTKAVIENQLLETVDNAYGLIEILYHNVVSKKHVTVDEWLEKIKNVTREEILAVGEKVQLDTIYFLTGSEVQK
ncbi:EF-P 5-aminopentanol modification-associated protein YfmF [Bacillus testis]|uniref:EF-P 5-aminopentanol modification-associated protein YfmF n=1 Tax=Bacillus testis TaxID=1622072 RepID=UPI00067F6EBF|nr:pitrilysin family protein [Bacillus testis]